MLPTAAPRRLSRCARHLSTASASRPSVIFSGIQPTGIPHLGNYLGALQQWVKLQNEAAPSTTLIFSVVDLHAITVPQDPLKLRQCRKEMLASLLAVGLDSKRSIIFNQSAVSAHSELMWILSCQASMGYLSRMTQWKSKLSLPPSASALDPKSANQTKNLKLGLFSYPVLQAADILVHRATHVPVGDDQSQHLEFARECAGSFNAHCAAGRSPVLVTPDTLLSPARRVMSLSQPAKKMSKSDGNPKSRILITDSRDDIVAKLRAALTDSIEGVSYEPETRPGVANLLDIMFHLGEAGGEGGPGSVEELASECAGLSMRALKERAVEVVDARLSGIRERYWELMQTENLLEEIAEEGAQKARESAEATMKEVREVVGL